MDLMGQVEEILADFKKSLQADGGDIELLGVTEGIVQVNISRTNKNYCRSASSGAKR